MKDTLYSGLPSMSEKDARMLNPLQLAWIGDTVWDLMVRDELLRSAMKMKDLNRQAVSSVNAAAQARAAEAVRNLLTEKELDLLRRGRNMATRHPKNQSLQDYQAATGLETLLGYLYLTGQEERIRMIWEGAKKADE